MQPAWEQVGEYMEGSIRQNFESGGRPQAWQPLKAATLLARAGGVGKAVLKKYQRTMVGQRGMAQLTKKAQRTIGGAKILIAAGNLLNSIHYVANQNGVEIGSPLVYAATHQYGRTSGRGAPIPKREFLAVQKDDAEAITKIIGDYLTEPMR
jgi:phage gpG-like protein